MRPINSDALYEKAKTAYENAPWQVRSIYGWFMNIITNEPTIDVVPVHHARWFFDEVEMEYVCSDCSTQAPIGMSSYILHKYCPNCGARMDLDGE